MDALSLSKVARGKLGARARERRKELGLSAKAVADQMDLDGVYVYSWEMAIPRSAEYDSRWEAALSVPSGWLRDLAAVGGDLVEDAVPNKRRDLAKKARAQRESLGITRAVMSEIIGVSAMTLIAWEKLLPTSSKLDANWELALKVEPGWLRQGTSGPASEDPRLNLTDSPDATLSSTMRQIFEWYVSHGRTHRAIIGARASSNENRTVDMLVQRYGVLGEDISTLHEVGKAHGLTRERARQILDKAVKRIASEKTSIPILDRIRSAATSMLPSTVANIDSALRPLLGESLSIEGAERFASEIIGETLLQIEASQGGTGNRREKIALGFGAETESSIKTMRQIALAMIRSCGAAHVYFVAGAASQELGRGIMPSEVIQTCSIWTNFEWIYEVDGWFWFGPENDNRAITCALKVLSVADRNVDIDEIQAAIAWSRLRLDADRAQPFLATAPNHIIKKVLAAVPTIAVLQFNDFRLADGVDQSAFADDILSESEREFVRAIRTLGGIASHRALQSELVQSRGMVLATFRMTLDSSPITRRLEGGLWSLVATKLNPEALCDAVASRTSALALERVGPWLELSVTIPSSAFERDDWYLPAPLAAAMSPGEYTVAGHSEAILLVQTERGHPLLRGIKKFIGNQRGLDVASLRIAIHTERREIRFDRVNIEGCA